MTRFENFLLSLGGHAMQPCIHDGQLCYTYSQLVDEIRRWELRLDSLNIESGSVVAIRADYSLAALAALFAVLARPAVAALIPRDRTARTFTPDTCAEGLLDFCADGTYQWTLLSIHSRHSLIDQLAASQEGGIILFTSGSRGVPKAALHSVEHFLHKFQKARGRALRTMAFLLFDHVAGLDTILYTLAHGGTLILTRRRDPESILSLIESHRVEALPTSPSFLRMLCAVPNVNERDLSSLQVITYGSEPMDPKTLARLNVRFPNTRINQKYGTTETGSPRTISRGNNSLWLKITNDDTETKVVDGVLWIRSEGSILGYLNAPSPILADGWYCTGDLVEVEGEWIRFVGRATDIINVGGKKVAPTEVEQVILELDFVSEAAVFGEPNVLLGQVVAAQASLTTAALDDPKGAVHSIRTHCRKRLSPYKVPIRIEVVTNKLTSDRHKRQRKLCSFSDFRTTG